jgi:hypothetical protein
VFICGWISKTGFDTRKVFWRAGESDTSLPTIAGHFDFPIDTYTIKQTELHTLNSIEDIKAIDILFD